MVGPIGCIAFLALVFVVQPLLSWLVWLPASIKDRDRRVAESQGAIALEGGR